MNDPKKITDTVNDFSDRVVRQSDVNNNNNSNNGHNNNNNNNNKSITKKLRDFINCSWPRPAKHTLTKDPLSLINPNPIVVVDDNENECVVVYSGEYYEMKPNSVVVFLMGATFLGNCYRGKIVEYLRSHVLTNRLVVIVPTPRDQTIEDWATGFYPLMNKDSDLSYDQLASGVGEQNQ